MEDYFKNQNQGHHLSSEKTKLDEMINIQTINFRAFMRTVGGIEIEDMQSKWEFEDALRDLQGRWSTIDRLHWEIENESGEEDVHYQAQFNKYEKMFKELKKTLNTKMWTMAHRDKTTPQMDIPNFNGNYHQWTSFKDLFTETIHKNPSLSGAQKMQFLKSKVAGEAERLIQHLQISSDNYEVCWELLNHRFGNMRLMFSSHVNMLISIPNMQQQSMSMIKKLHDITKETLHGIKNIGVDITTWDPLLVHLLSQKLDYETFSEYIKSLRKPRELPVLQEFLDFLESKFTTLEASNRKQEPTYPKYNTKPIASHQNINSSPDHLQGHSNQFQKYSNYKKPTNVENITKSIYIPKSSTCALCNSNHGLWQCSKFHNMTPEQKLKTVNNMKYCVNCLINHFNKPCFSTKQCRNCLGNHNTLLHEAFKPKPSTSSKSNNNTTLRTPTRVKTPTTTHVSSNGVSEILLSTALVKVMGKDGTLHTMRALIDQGSQISLITENAAQMLGLRRSQCKGKIFGVGEKENNCKGVMNIEIQSMHNEFSLSANVLIMNHLIKNLPNTTFTKPSWLHIQNINLADPEFYYSRCVDLLLGADVYSKIILGGILKGENDDQPIAQQTQLGWLLCGAVSNMYNCNVVLHNTEDLRRFWECEDINQQSEMTSDEQECLQNFLMTTKRLQDGRYEVRLPFKPELKEKLGTTRSLALVQFCSLEKKLEKNINLKTEYHKFINEYYNLNHMKPCYTETTLGCFLPHHAVTRAESTTTKVRVVFNASAKSASGLSLNDTMYKGPNLQQDLLELILKWRQYQFVYTADIEKMYRQIKIHEEDQIYQKILWRDNPNQPIKAYQLTTVTYGTKSAPFLAMMCLKQLANDENNNFPNAAKALNENFYMDDFCGGHHSISEANKLKADLIEILRKGGFNLRKWTTNEPKLIDDLDIDQCNQHVYEFKRLDSTKTLGLGWNPQKDLFIFKPKLEPQQQPQPTKRSLLSDISKLFDPLGWLTPLSTTMKILFQNVWLSTLDWDDVLPDHITQQWTTLRQDLNEINTIEIKRWLGMSEHNEKVEFHGFCDASTKAYAGVIYCKIIKDKQTTITLVAAKARLAPLNKNVSIPRLELMGAQLLTKLMLKITNCLSDYNAEKFCWSDSTAVLGWIKGDPARWKPFVANRVKFITQIIPSYKWGYIKTNENPADCASRGLSIKQLKNNELWWQGPSWLSSYSKTKNKNEIYETKLELKSSVLKSNTVTIENKEDIIYALLNKFSSINKITRILAWILRLHNSKKNRPAYLTLYELRRAKLLIIKYVQVSEFANDIQYLQNHDNLHCKSKILNLNPFIDQDGILRVGGRLRNANISLQMKHPIIIPHNHRLTTLLIQEAHKLTFHGGSNITLANLRQRYWIIKAYSATKKFIRQCIICRKHDPIKQYQLMGDLPASRVNPECAFYHCGVDFTGFVEVKASKGRGIKTTKGYIAVFICMVTKAVHLELVSDLSSSGFLAALTRMSARRIAPRHIYSDNGTNFVGANRMLQEEYNRLQQIFNTSFLTEVTEMGIMWHFNAPAWPSAGGLWERAVRSLKYHLKRVIGHQKLTYEEYSTLLTKLEACLNSRPLCALSEDPENLDFLTPAHFLTGRPGLTIIDTEHDARTRWHLTTKLFHDLWKRWKTEYLTQLSARKKWMNLQKNIKVDDLVVIHDDNLPAGKWAMGRVIDTHPGDDGLIRIVTLKTKNGLLKRPIIKLSVLPLNQSNQNSIQEESKQLENIPGEKIKRPKKPTFTTIVAALLFFMTLLIPSNGLHNIHQLPSNQTLYFDPISNIQLIRDKWTLIMYYNMEPYWTGIDAYNKITNYLEKVCNMIGQQSHCNIILTQQRHDYQEFKYYNELLLTQHFNVHTRRRRRRGLINGVGYVANELFGVLDSRFAEKYMKDIEALKQNQNHLSYLLKNQTSVIASEFNLMKRMEVTIDKQHKFINSQLNNWERRTNELKENIQNMSYNQDFTLCAMAGNSLLLSLKRLQDTLLDMITDIYNGQISIHLLTPTQLKAELLTIRGHMLHDLMLPVNDINTDLQYIYKLLRVKARVSENYIIFEITLPLVYRESFQLYQILPIPHQNNESIITIVPVSDYVAVNFKKESYFAVTINELNTCLYHGSSYMCQFLKPIHDLKDDKSFCNTNTQNHECKIYSSMCTNRWIELHMTSQYLYYCCDVYSIKIICDDQVTKHQLSNAGIITIAQNCIIKGKDFVLHSLQRHFNQINSTNELYIPIIDQINHIINLKLPVNDTPLLYNHDLNSSFTKLSRRIETLKSMSDEIDDISPHDIHHYAVSYILLAVSLSLLVAYLWKKGRCRFCSRTAVRGGGNSRQESVHPAPPASSTSDIPMGSVQSRKQSTADPSQTSASAVNVRNQILAKRWPSVRRGRNNCHGNQATMPGAIDNNVDNPTFILEDSLV